MKLLFEDFPDSNSFSIQHNYKFKCVLIENTTVIKTVNMSLFDIFNFYNKHPELTYPTLFKRIFPIASLFYSELKNMREYPHTLYEKECDPVTYDLKMDLGKQFVNDLYTHNTYKENDKLLTYIVDVYPQLCDKHILEEYGPKYSTTLEQYKKHICEPEHLLYFTDNKEIFQFILDYIDLHKWLDRSSYYAKILYEKKDKTYYQLFIERLQLKPRD